MRLRSSASFLTLLMGALPPCGSSFLSRVDSHIESPVGNRLSVREATVLDEPFFLNVRLDPAVLEMSREKTGPAFAHELREQFKWIIKGGSATDPDHRLFLHVVSLGAEGQGPIRDVGLVQGRIERDGPNGPTATIGFALAPEFWRRGLAVESVRASLARLRDRYGVRTVVAYTYAMNAASVQTLKRLGFQPGPRMILTEPGFLHGLQLKL